jgi:uncharacterized protein (TIGR02147 family)
MSIHALEELPMEVRDHSAMTMAISRKRLPEAREKIKAFRRELCGFLEKGSDLDSVYQLGISLYPVAQVEKD